MLLPPGTLDTDIMLGPDWRVRPLDHLQWVVERRAAGRLEHDGARWLPEAYCRTRVGLFCALSRLAPGLDTTPLAGLPAAFVGAASNTVVPLGRAR